MGGIRFNIVDTAGLRKTTDVVENEGVRRSMLKIEEADIILHVRDLASKESYNNNQALPAEKLIAVANKSDLGGSITDSGELPVSAKTGKGMRDLEQTIVNKARSLISKNSHSDIIITNQRHRDCLLKSCEYLVNAHEQILSGGGNELISFEIRAAMDSLTEIIGKTANVDILNNIFTKFCIGK